MWITRGSNPACNAPRHWPACALLNIRSEEALRQYPAVAAVWEAFIFARLRTANQGTSEQLRLLIRVSEANGPAAANEMVPKVFRPQKIEEMVTRWSTIPYLQARSPVIADATAAYRSGMYSLVIPALLPLAEGLAYELVGGGRQKYDAVQRAARAQKDQVSADDQPWFDAMMKFLDDVYSWMDFAQTAPAGSFSPGHDNPWAKPRLRHG